MINDNRIVPVTATDLITLYGTAMLLASVSVAAVNADAAGEFELVSGLGNFLADEPVKKFVFGSSVTSATVYFIPSYDYKGFAIAGTSTIVTGEVKTDGGTLYKAVLSSGAVTISKAGF